MLVLTRKPGQEMVIPSLGVTIQLVETDGKKVRLGINAPREIVIHRKEVWDQIQANHARTDTLAHTGATCT